jgi:predicted nucleotidyltransferase
MKIEPSDTIVGQPALIIRRLLRKGYGFLWGIGLVEEILHVDSRTAKRIIKGLDSEGYIEKKDSGRQCDYWENTIKGNALALASAAKSVKRARAEEKLQAFLERVKHVKDNDYFLYKVEKVIIFGSFLTLRESVNDIDIAIKLVPKTRNHEELQKRSRQRIREVQEKGRIFGNFLDELAWPQTEVKRYLKSRSRIISLHDSDDGVLQHCESQVMYEDPPDADA